MKDYVTGGSIYHSDYQERVSVQAGCVEKSTEDARTRHNIEII